MKIALIREGNVVVDQIPAPQIDWGMVLVRVDYSCISAGTELSGVQNSVNPPLWKRALDNPEKVLEVARKVTQKGARYARNFVETKLAGGEAGRPTGYSAAGVVVEVASDIVDLLPGARVACAGSQFAYHAEWIAVPRNLVVPIPDDLNSKSASTVTLGAIALQGLRRAQPTLGETFVVIGLGILGQLTIQMLKANGCRVIGIDLDRARIERARSLGMEAAIHPDDGDDLQITARLTDGAGADGVIITAATRSDAVIASAFKQCRRKGRVVIVGDVGLNLNRADFYEKEIDLLISTSYGPGRYDRRYEEDNLDYPIGYVRWTENRNMSEYLRMLSGRRVSVESLIDQVYPIDNAEQAFSAFASLADRPLIVLLNYPQGDNATPQRTIINPRAGALVEGKVKVGMVGAGSFAADMLLPNLRLLGNRYYLHTVVTRTGDHAAKIARQYNFRQASTSFEALVTDPDIDAVVIATRHDQHAKMALAALSAGKHVFLEKPTVLTSDELARLKAFFDETKQSPFLLTDYNRHFSPHIRQIMQWLSNRREPLIVNYRMNAGYIPKDHWVFGEQGGGRNRGEACHIYDLFVLLTGSTASAIHAQPVRVHNDYYTPMDNFVATISFDDGSVCTLTYTAFGTSAYPKEAMDIFCEGRVITLDDYRHTTLYGGKEQVFETATVEKGHKEILEVFADALTKGDSGASLLESQLETMRITLEVETCLRQVVEDLKDI